MKGDWAASDIHSMLRILAKLPLTLRALFNNKSLELAGSKSSAARKLGLGNALILIAFTLSLLLIQLGSSRTITLHEGYVVESAREMRATGDWLVPRIGGDPWLEKPPLPQWCVAASGWLFGGLNEFSARLPAVICGLLGVLMIASLIARYRGSKMGLLAGLIQATTLWFVGYSRLAEADIYLWVVVVAAIATFARCNVEPIAEQRWHSSRWMFFLLLGLTQLSKGPLFGAVLVLLPVFGFLLSQPKRSSIKWALFVPGWVIFALVGCAWPFLVSRQHPEAIALWMEHTFGRVSKEIINPKPFWYYFSVLPWVIAPWTLAVLPALRGSLRRAWNEPRSLDRLMFLWFLLPLLALSVPRGKHHHYLMHALPPCSYWAALGLVWWARLVGRVWSRPVWRWTIVSCLIAGVTTAGVITQIKLPSVAIEVGVLGIIVTLGVVVSMRCCAHHRLAGAAAALFAMFWLGHTYVHAFWEARTDGRRVESVMFKRLPSTVEPNARIFIFQQAPALPLFYSGRHIEEVWKLDEIRPRNHEPVYLLCSVNLEPHISTALHLERVDQTDEPLPYPGRRVTLVLYRVNDRGL